MYLILREGLKKGMFHLSSPRLKIGNLHFFLGAPINSVEKFFFSPSLTQAGVPVWKKVCKHYRVSGKLKKI